MKKALLVFCFAAIGILFAKDARAEWKTVPAPLVLVNPSTGTYCESISTSTWTKIPSAGNSAGRSGIYVLNLPGNTANMGAQIIKESSNGDVVAPTGPITRYDLLLKKGDPERDFPYGENFYLYVISLHTAAETVCWQEYWK